MLCGKGRGMMCILAHCVCREGVEQSQGVKCPLVCIREVLGGRMRGEGVVAGKEQVFTRPASVASPVRSQY